MERQGAGKHGRFYIWKDINNDYLGESHGAGIGVVVDGCPAGLLLAEEDIQKYLDRRKPGQSRYTTKRNESDSVEIMSGVFEGRTTGTPIAMMIRNQDQHSKDYSEIAGYYRPGHADYTFDKNMVSGTTAGAEDPRAGKPSAEWRPELWRPRFWRALESG